MTTTTTTTTKTKIGLAIVGCGQIVTHHLTAIAAASSSEFVIRALIDPNEERRRVIRNLPEAASLYEEVVVVLNSLDELLQQQNHYSKTLLSSIDVILIAVPHDLHEPLCQQALQLNKTVVLEKPLAVTTDACENLLKLSQDNMLIVAEQSPYWQEVVSAKQLIREGKIGTIITAASYYYESMRDNITSGGLENSGGGLGWRGSLKRSGGGIMMDGGLHWIRPLSELLGGRITRVVGRTRKNLAPSLQLEGEVLAHGLFEIAENSNEQCEFLKQNKNAGPLIATYSCNMLATAPMAHDACPYFRITGDAGEIVIHGDGLFKDKPGAGGLRLYNQEHPDGIEMFSNDRRGGFFNGFTGLWKEIHRIHVENDQKAAHETVIRAADDVRVVLALYKSSESGKWEETQMNQESE